MINNNEIEAYRLPLPTDEDWRLTPLARLYQNAVLDGTDGQPRPRLLHKDIQPFVLAGCDYLVIVDGRVDLDLSASALHYLATAEVTAETETETETLTENGRADFARFTVQFRAPYTAVAITVEEMPRPLQIIQIDSGARHGTSHSRLALRIGDGTIAEVIETQVSLQPKTQAATKNWNNHLFELRMGIGAQLRSYHEFGTAAGLHPFDTHAIVASLDSHAHWQATKVMRADTAQEMGVAGGQGFIRHEISVELKGVEAEFNLQAIVMAEQSQKMILSTRLQHSQPHCSSEQAIKVISRDQSDAVMQGLIWVHPDAQKTEAHLLARGMILAESKESQPRGQINLKPELKIYADDVKCSHGATVGEMDREALFYLTSRGLTTTAAREILIAAFISSALESLDYFTQPAIALAAQKLLLEEAKNV